MDERPLVSVVIPTRNRADLLSDVLGSLVEQDYPADRYEILVVDDGSIDDTPSVVEALAQAHSKPRLSLLRQPAKNQNAARNRGVSEAKGELIAFLDDDELAPANWLSGLVAGCMRHPDADVVGGPYQLRLEASTPRVCEAHWPGVDGAFGLGQGTDVVGSVARRPADRDHQARGTLLRHGQAVPPGAPLATHAPSPAVPWGGSEEEVEHVAGGNMLIRRRAFARTGKFNESLQGWYDETEWMFRHRRGGGQIVYLPSVPTWHRRGATDMLLRKRLRKNHSSGRLEARFHHTFGRSVRLRKYPTIGRWEARSHHTLGRSVPVLFHVYLTLRHLGHAVLFRCSGGLTEAAYSLGYAREAMWPASAD
jgi:glycosyltransferase involved in cell wall biosynthesis